MRPVIACSIIIVGVLASVLVASLINNTSNSKQAQGNISVTRNVDSNTNSAVEEKTQSDYTISVPPPTHTLVPTNMIVDETISETSTIDFNNWKYGNVKAILEITPKGNSFVNIGQYSIDCVSTVTGPDYSKDTYLGIDGQYHWQTMTKKLTSRIGGEWITASYEGVATKSTFTTYNMMSGTPCEEIHIHLEYQPYFKGVMAVKATLLT